MRKMTARIGLTLTLLWLLAVEVGYGQVISTVAGGSVGDGGAATSANLNNPRGVFGRRFDPDIKISGSAGVDVDIHGVGANDDESGISVG